MRDLFSLIKWNENLKDAPNDEILIIYKDDRFDYVSYDTMLANKINSDIWISNNETVYVDNIICWAELPKYKDMKVFN